MRLKLPFSAALLLVAAIGQPGYAQLPNLFPVPDLLPLDYPWIGINYPKLFWTSRDGVTAGAKLSMIRQLSLDDYSNPAPYEAALIVDGQAAASGSRELRVELNAPFWAHGWRFRAILSGKRENEYNYFGIGNNDIDESLGSSFYRARATRHTARAEIQRWLTGPIRIFAALNAERWKLEAKRANSRIAADSALGFDPTFGRSTTDVAWIFGAAFDSRDDEVSPNRGLLIEAIFSVADSDFVGDVSYTRTTISLAGYAPIRENLTVAARIVGQGMGGTPRTGSLSRIESTVRPYSGVGGGDSFRALDDNRLLGRHKLFANIDARYHLLNVPRTARLTLVGFLDAGRVFDQGESFALTTDGLKVGGGAGIFVQVMRTGIVGTTVAAGPDGLRLDLHSHWPF